MMMMMTQYLMIHVHVGSVGFIGSSRCGNAGNTSYTELKMEMFGLGSQGQGYIVFDMS